jgi:hypothetical protein
VVLAAVVGVVQAATPALLAPATANGPWVLPAVVVGSLVGAFLGPVTVARRGRGNAGSAWSPGPLLVGAVVVVVVAGGAGHWRTGLAGLLAQVDLAVGRRLLLGSIIVALPVALVAACSATALAGVLSRKLFAGTAAAAAAAALATPALLLVGPERALALAGLVLGLVAVATELRAAAPSKKTLAGAGLASFVAGVLVVSPPVGDGRGHLSRSILLGRPPAPVRGDVVLDERDTTGRTTVVVGDDISLYRDGKADASLWGDAGTQALLAVLPLLYVPEAASAVVVGLGSGATARWLADVGVEVEALEIADAVVRASALFGEGPLPPNVRVHRGDARATLAGAGTVRGDVVSAEPSNAFVGGNARLFSRQALLSFRDSSNSGVVVLWTHGYLTSVASARILLDTARSVFAAVDVFPGPTGDAFLVGRPRDRAPDLDLLRARLGPRLPCVLGATGLLRLEDLVDAAVAAPTEASTAGPHDDLRPTLVPAAVRALLENASVGWARSPRAIDAVDPDGGITARGVLARLGTTEGRASLREGGARLRLLDDDPGPAWALPLARAGLALLGNEVRVDDVLAGLHALAVPRCANAEVLAIARVIARNTAERRPDARSAIDAAVARLVPTRTAGRHVIERVDARAGELRPAPPPTDADRAAQ